MAVFKVVCEKPGDEVELFPEGLKPSEWVVEGKPAILLGTAHGKMIVAGNTFPLRDDLKQLGFAWNGLMKKWVMEENPNLLSIDEVASELGKKATVYFIQHSSNLARANSEKACLESKDGYSIMRHFHKYFTQVKKVSE